MRVGRLQPSQLNRVALKNRSGALGLGRTGQIGQALLECLNIPICRKVFGRVHLWLSGQVHASGAEVCRLTSARPSAAGLLGPDPQGVNALAAMLTAAGNLAATFSINSLSGPTIGS
jgi:hypothetical protein